MSLSGKTMFVEGGNMISWRAFVYLFSLAVFVYLMAWAPLLLFYIKYKYVSTEIYSGGEISRELEAAGFQFRYPVDIVPADCRPDPIWFHFFPCDDMATFSSKLLREGHARSVVAPSSMPEIVKKEDRSLNKLVVLKVKDQSIYYELIDNNSLDRRANLSFDCVVTYKSAPNMFSIYIITEICGYNGDFIYKVTGMGSDYGYPYNPIGDSVIPLKITSWIDYARS